MGEEVQTEDQDPRVYGGFWSLPIPDPYGNCNDMASVKWLTSTSPISCSREGDL